MMNTKTLKTSITLFVATVGLALTSACAQGTAGARPGMHMPRTPAIEQRSAALDKAPRHTAMERVRPTHQVEVQNAIVCPPSRGF